MAGIINSIKVGEKVIVQADMLGEYTAELIMNWFNGNIIASQPTANIIDENSEDAFFSEMSLSKLNDDFSITIHGDSSGDSANTNIFISQIGQLFGVLTPFDLGADINSSYNYAVQDYGDVPATINFEALPEADSYYYRNLGMYGVNSVLEVIALEEPGGNAALYCHKINDDNSRFVSYMDDITQFEDALGGPLFETGAQFICWTSADCSMTILSSSGGLYNTIEFDDENISANNVIGRNDNYVYYSASWYDEITDEEKLGYLELTPDGTEYSFIEIHEPEYWPGYLFTNFNGQYIGISNDGEIFSFVIYDPEPTPDNDPEIVYGPGPSYPVGSAPANPIVKLGCINFCIPMFNS